MLSSSAGTAYQFIMVFGNADWITSSHYWSHFFKVSHRPLTRLNCRAIKHRQIIVKVSQRNGSNEDLKVSARRPSKVQLHVNIPLYNGCPCQSCRSMQWFPHTLIFFLWKTSKLIFHETRLNGGRRGLWLKSQSLASSSTTPSTAKEDRASQILPLLWDSSNRLRVGRAAVFARTASTRTGRQTSRKSTGIDETNKAHTKTSWVLGLLTILENSDLRRTRLPPPVSPNFLTSRCVSSQIILWRKGHWPGATTVANQARGFLLRHRLLTAAGPMGVHKDADVVSNPVTRGIRYVWSVAFLRSRSRTGLIVTRRIGPSW